MNTNPPGHVWRCKTKQPIIHQLHHLRVAKKLSLVKLADIIGVANSSLATWERGDYSPQFHSLIAWANALGMELCLCPIKSSTKLPAPVQSPTHHSSPAPKSNSHGIAPR